MKVSIVTLDNSAVGDLDLADEVFGTEPRKDILARVVNYQLAKRRSGTHKVKERNEIARTGKKLGNQKGGGGARHGSRRSNIFVGGGVVHGPRVRSHATKLQKKVRAMGMRSALSAKAAAGELIILDSATAASPKTAELRNKLSLMGVASALVITGDSVDENFGLASSNIPGIDVLPTAGANVYDILRREKLVLTKDAAQALEARLK